MKLDDVIDIILSVPLARLQRKKLKGKKRIVYNQTHFDNDSIGMIIGEEDNEDRISVGQTDMVLRKGDIVVACNTGRAAVVGKEHEGYVLSMNFMCCRVKEQEQIDPVYLGYVLNEDESIKRQQNRLVQGSVVLRYTAPQLRELAIPALPDLKRQQQIGSLYMKTLRLEALRKRVAEHKRSIVMEILKGV